MMSPLIPPQKQRWLHIAKAVVMDYISKQHDSVPENFRTGGSFKSWQSDFWHRDQGSKSSNAENP